MPSKKPRPVVAYVAIQIEPNPDQKWGANYAWDEMRASTKRRKIEMRVSGPNDVMKYGCVVVHQFGHIAKCAMQRDFDLRALFIDIFDADAPSLPSLDMAIAECRKHRAALVVDRIDRIPNSLPDDIGVVVAERPKLAAVHGIRLDAA